MGWIDKMDASNAKARAERLSKRAAKLEQTDLEKARRLTEEAGQARQAYDAKLKEIEDEQAAKTQAAADKAAAKASLNAYRAAHPHEQAMNRRVPPLVGWPKAEAGRTRYGPVRAAQAELFNADAHKAWTATRLVSNATVGIASGGLGMTGRKNKGKAQINITFENGMVHSFPVKPEKLAVARGFVAAFNAYSEQLVRESQPPAPQG